MRIFCYIIIAAFFCPSARGQQLSGNDLEVPGNTPTLNEVNETGILYKYEMTFGILAHSNGFGLNYRRGRHITGYKKRIFEIEAVNIKHPKEYKVYNPSRENAKGYIFGKINSFLILRPGLFEKAPRYRGEGSGFPAAWPRPHSRKPPRSAGKRQAETRR